MSEIERRYAEKLAARANGSAELRVRQPEPSNDGFDPRTVEGRYALKLEARKRAAKGKHPSVQGEPEVENSEPQTHHEPERPSHHDDRHRKHHKGR